MVGNTVSEENLLRTAEKLRAKATWLEEGEAERLATPTVLLEGREILATKCVICHDLKTIMDGPKTPDQWYKTCVRMAEKPTFGDPLTEDDIPKVTAYLVAITPDIVRHRFQKRTMKKKQDEVASSLEIKPKATAVEVDMEAARELVDDECTSCHELDILEEFEEKTEEGWREIVTEMIEEEGVELSEDDAEIIVQYLVLEYPSSPAE